jgi:hypothetical protein
LLLTPRPGTRSVELTPDDEKKTALVDGDLLFINRRGNLQRGEGVFLQVEKTVQVMCDQFLVIRGQWCLLGKLLDKVVDQLAAGAS